MKTKLKTSSKSQKQESILENSNFLNSQNYILGKNEKKKLLSKFFIENNILFFLNLFNNIKIIFSKKIKFKRSTQFIAIYSYLIPFIYFSVINVNVFFMFLSFLFPLPVIFILKYFALKNSNYKKDFVEISSFKQLFFRKELNIFGTFFFMGIYLSSPLIIFFQLLIGDNMIALYVGIFFIFTLIFKKIIKKILKLKLLFILFLPFLIILEIFIGTYYYIKFIFLGIKSFKITKFSYKKNLINKFLLLNKNYGENLFYKIEVNKGKQN